MANGQDTALSDREKSRASNLNIIKVDKENNTIFLQVDGYPVTVACREEPNVEVYEKVKALLISCIA